jgi:archaellum component FlaC
VKKAKGEFPMPTQEERPDALENNLEQLKTETIMAYGEMAVEMTMVKGLTEDAVHRLAALKDQIEHRFGRVDIRLDAMDAHLESMDGHFGRVDTRLDKMDAQLESINGRFEHVDTRLDKMDAHLEGVDSRLGRLENLLAQVLARLPEKP